MRLSLAVDLKSRDGTLSKDARAQNLIIEKVGEDQNGPIYDALSRPGSSDVGQIGAVTSAQMLAVWNGMFHTIHNDLLARNTLATPLISFAVLNSADKNANVSLSNGDLTASNSSGTYNSVRGTLGKSSGKWYWEVTGGNYLAGVGNASAGLTPGVGADANGWSVLSTTGQKFTGGVAAAYTTAFSASEVIGFALDMGAGTITVYRNGASLGTMHSGLTGTLYPMVSPVSGDSVTVNFGQNAFTWPVPSGFNPMASSAGGVVRALNATNIGQRYDFQDLSRSAGVPALWVKNRTNTWAIFTDGTIANNSTPAALSSYIYAISSLTRSGSTATAIYTQSAYTQRIAVGDSVVIANATDAAYNGTKTVTAIGTDSTTGLPTFSYTVAGSPATPDSSTTITATAPGTLVPGWAYVNGYLVAMEANGKVWHTTADAITWSGSSTFFLSARQESGGGVAINKTLNYVVCFKEWSTEYLYDAKNPSGSAFAPVENGFTRIGCAAGYSVALAAGAMLCWIGQTKASGIGVYAMQGMQQQKISTEDVDRILAGADLSTVYAFGIDVRGHQFYLVTIKNENITLAYDFTSQKWCTWTSLTIGNAVNVSGTGYSGNTLSAQTSSPHGLSDGDPAYLTFGTADDGIYQVNVTSSTVFTVTDPRFGGANQPTLLTVKPYTETYFKYVMAAVYLGELYFLHETDGHLYKLDTSLKRDAGAPINFFSRTEPIDSGGAPAKMGKIRVIGDLVDSTAMVRWSDDDGATFVAQRIVDLDTKPAETRKCGAFRRRSLEFRHVNNAALRVRALEVE